MHFYKSNTTDKSRQPAVLSSQPQIGIRQNHSRVHPEHQSASSRLIPSLQWNLLLLGERLRRRRNKQGEDQLSFWQAILVGTSQVLALIPGISRSGITVVGGMASGLSAEMAGRFAFLLATPIILAAGVLEVPKLIHYGTAHTLGIAVFGGVIAGIAAYISTSLLMLLFRRREIETLGPFGYYCTGAGIVSMILLLVRKSPFLRGNLLLSEIRVRTEHQI